MKRNLTLVSGMILGTVIAVAVLLSAGRLLADTGAVQSVPQVMSYQGTLSDSDGPLSGPVNLVFRIYDASTGGNLLWEESHSSVPVSNGYFDVLLGSVSTPLTSSIFDGSSRYLQVAVNGGDPLPRQRIASTPYALRADKAESAMDATYAMTATYAMNAKNAMTATYASSAGSASTASSASSASSATTAISATYAMTATYAMSAPSSSGSNYAYEVVVAKSGGDYTSVAAALDSISDASSSKRYLVYVAPGVYTETALVDVKPYVHLMGAGPNATVVQSSRSDIDRSSSAATVRVRQNGRLSQMTVRNNAGSGVAIGVYNTDTDERTTVMDTVRVEVLTEIPSGENDGTEHHALYIKNSHLIVRNSSLQADGAKINAALGGEDSVSPLSLATIEGTWMKGGPDTASAFKSGYGVLVQDQRVRLRDVYVRGSTITVRTDRVDFPGLGPNSTVENSILEGYFRTLEAQLGTAIRVAGSQFIGTGTTNDGAGLVKCINTYDANFDAKTCTP